MFQIPKNDSKAFAKVFDQSMLRPTNLRQEYIDMANDAIKYGFKCLAFCGFMVKEVSDIILPHGIDCSIAVGFPYGLNHIDIKVAEAIQGFKDGATDADYILNFSRVLDHDWDYVHKEMKAFTDLARDWGKHSKIIFETCLLNEEEIVTLCKIANEYKPDFIKTCTGTAGPCTAEHIHIMRREALPEISIKASGGVTSLARVEEMVAAGADRCGTLVADQITEEYIAKYCK